MIWLMMKAAMKPPIMFPSPPSTQIIEQRTERVADEGMHVVLQCQETGAETGERAADSRGHEINASLIDPHEPDDLAILRNRANGGADVGALEKHIERDRPRQGDAERKQARVANIDSADLNHRQPNADVAKVSGEK